MDVDTWYAILSGEQRGKVYRGNLHYVKKKNTKERVKQDILTATKTDISPPTNYNLSSAVPSSTSSAKTKKKGKKINADILKRICTLP